jgi:hypothetical protein
VPSSQLLIFPNILTHISLSTNELFCDADDDAETY